MLSAKQRKFLRGKAHHLEPVVQVGKAGISSALIEEASNALGAHELIKVKFVDHKDERELLATQLAESCTADLVGCVGNIAIIFKQAESKEKQKFTLP